ncbi:MAG: DUF2058 domain-containing protein [bacterium]|nr:DUF2058 domain-containing protein [Gammaproteobacteria bacterium]HIL94915.1 DUF2058 domain-containing protein [Pseudomonadales bacterium]
MAKKKKSGGSLQDQLKSAGLVTDKQIRKAKKGMHRQQMRVKQGVEVDEVKQAAEQTLADKQHRDREQNEQLNQAAQARALQAQIKQLIEVNSQRQDGDVAYNFTEQNKIKKIYISQLNKTQLNKGFLAIVKSGESYDLVPEQVARKIMARIPETYDEVMLYLHNRTAEVVDEDDPYKDFQIPDDLEW